MDKVLKVIEVQKNSIMNQIGKCEAEIKLLKTRYNDYEFIQMVIEDESKKEE